MKGSQTLHAPRSISALGLERRSKAPVGPRCRAGQSTKHPVLDELTLLSAQSLAVGSQPATKSLIKGPPADPRAGSSIGSTMLEPAQGPVRLNGCGKLAISVTHPVAVPVEGSASEADGRLVFDAVQLSVLVASDPRARPFGAAPLLHALQKGVRHVAHHAPVRDGGLDLWESKRLPHLAVAPHVRRVR